MQQTSELWKTLLATPGTSRVYKFSVDGVEMGENTESDHSVTHALFENLSIGNAPSASLHYEVYADSIERGQKICRSVRLERGKQVSEWLPAGVFFVNTADVEDGLWTVEAVDAMRKANIPWIPQQNLEFPMPMDKVMELAAQIVGVEIDPRSEFEATYSLDYPTEEYTIRNLWQYVAAAHGGNIIITPEGKLRLVKMYGEHDVVTVADGDYTSLVNNGKWPPVSRVTLMRDQSNGDTAGDDTGTEIKGMCFTATQEMVADILGRLQGIEYQAYSCSAAGLDPAAELGDAVDFGGLHGLVCRIEDDGYGFPNISFPGERQMDELYPEDGPVTSELKREIGKARAEITKTAEEIRLEVSSSISAVREDLDGFSNTVTGSLEGLQAQIDGQIQTWFDSYVPAPDNAPASSWTTEEEKINHLGDIFYIVENETIGGQAFRWAQVSGVYQWVLIEDVEVAKALADAARAQDTADGKRRVFVSQPVPPYDVGDLWAQGDSGDLMRCNAARTDGDYAAEDWGKASDYTNDDALHEFVDGEYAGTKDTVANQGQQINTQEVRISNLEVNADAISATVQRVQTDTKESLDSVNQSISELSEKVSLTLTPEQVDIVIDQKLAQGVETVRTSTGFTFDEEGLTVSKTGSEMTTQVTEDGMTVSRSGSEVLVANNQGVQATNLNANTFLIIAGKARFEEYGADRIGCFWIGG